MKNLENYGTVLGRGSKNTTADTSVDENATAIKRKTEKSKFRPGKHTVIKCITAHM